jgi:hypothetical protein
MGDASSLDASFPIKFPFGSSAFSRSWGREYQGALKAIGQFI